MMQALRPGFSDPVHQSQQVFRRMLDAMARPGLVQTVADLPQAAPGLSPAATAVCLTLYDFETPLWLDAKAQLARNYLVFHCGAPIVEQPQQAGFALIAVPRELQNFMDFGLGSDEYPETSTTLIVDVEGLTEGVGQTLAGPGIEGNHRLSVDGVAENFWQSVRDNHLLFPRGVDLIMTCGDRIVALPRSVRVLPTGD